MSKTKVIISTVVSSLILVFGKPPKIYLYLFMIFLQGYLPVVLNHFFFTQKAHSNIIFY